MRKTVLKSGEPKLAENKKPTQVPKKDQAIVDCVEAEGGKFGMNHAKLAWQCETSQRQHVSFRPLRQTLHHQRRMTKTRIGTCSRSRCPRRWVRPGDCGTPRASETTTKHYLSHSLSISTPSAKSEQNYVSHCEDDMSQANDSER